MKYEKPLIVRSSDAVSAVCSTDPQKGPSGMDSESTSQQSVSAYQADE